MEEPLKDTTTGLIHLYRAEIGRMTTYRTRLDTTTNWAVGTTGAITTFVLSRSELPHFALGLALLLDILFLWMEAHRFRVYQMIRARVRLMEQGFYVELLGGQALDGWRDALVESLRAPSHPITVLQSISSRMRRGYFWILAILYVAWLVKIEIGGQFPNEASLGSMSGLAVVAVVTCSLVPLLWLALLHRPSEEG